MEESIKKMVYAGVGLAAQATEKFEKTVNDLIQRGKISDKEGKKIVDEFFKKTEKKKDSFESRFRSTTEEIIERFNFATQKDVKSLKKKIEKLEKELKGTKGKKATAKKSTAKKTTAKKTTRKATAPKKSTAATKASPTATKVTSAATGVK